MSDGTKITHDHHPSLLALQQRHQVSTFDPDAAAEDDNTQAITVTHHNPEKSMYALQHTQMVDRGLKYWEEKEDYQPMQELEWWKLKSAKDFEAGIGQVFYDGGILNAWTDQQIVTLQKDMMNTLQLITTADDQQSNNNSSSKAKTKEVNLSDFAAEILKQKETETDNKSEKNVQKDDNGQHTVKLYDFDDEIIHTFDVDSPTNKTNADMELLAVVNIINNEDNNDYGNKDIKKGVRFQTLTSLDSLVGAYDPKKYSKHGFGYGSIGAGPMIGNKADVVPSGHRRTRTQALRVQLSNMQSKLNSVKKNLQNSEIEIQNKSQKLENAEENAKQYHIRIQSHDKLVNEIAGINGALLGATNELDRAEDLISEKDQQIANLSRELNITKQLNRELIGTSIDETGLSADDLLALRMKDANRFAFMLAAMQEQLEFERMQFVKKVHDLEARLEHKDVQLNALYQLYNKLVDHTQKKSWWKKLID